MPSNTPLHAVTGLGRLADEYQRRWLHEILRAHTAAKLTHPHKDNLVAIDAVATPFATVRKDWYTCGMFWSDLPEALCLKQDEDSPAQRAPQYRAPSWSWAAVDGEIAMPDAKSFALSICVIRGTLAEDFDYNALLLRKNSDGTFSRPGKSSYRQSAMERPLSPLSAAIRAQPAQLIVLV
ncbi:hypothetical protein LTR95_002596 [Oleoguttula sp. CCFEE 5521]